MYITNFTSSFLRRQESINYIMAYVYILASKSYGTLYVWVTNNLSRRIYQHKNKEVDGFTKKYNIIKLVRYEIHPSILSAINKEKQLKKRKRNRKIKLIEKNNPLWEDLYYWIV